MAEIDDERRQGVFGEILDTLKKSLEVQKETQKCTCASLEVLKRIEKLQTPKPQKLKVTYANWFSECRCKTNEEKIEMSTIIVPVGPNTATIQALDANGSDVTGSCTISAVSSDPTVVQIGNPDATTPNVIPFTSLVPGGSATITYDVANAAGDITQTDTINVEITAPASMVITYGASLPATAAQLKAGTKTPPVAKR